MSKSGIDGDGCLVNATARESLTGYEQNLYKYFPHVCFPGHGAMWPRRKKSYQGGQATLVSLILSKHPLKALMLDASTH